MWATLLAVGHGATAALAAEPAKKQRKFFEMDFVLQPSAAYFIYQEFKSGEETGGKYKIYIDVSGPVYGAESKLKMVLNFSNILGATIIPFDTAVYYGNDIDYKGRAGDLNVPLGPRNVTMRLICCFGIGVCWGQPLPLPTVIG